MLLAAVYRLLWFVIAAAIGLLWSYSEHATGKALSMQAHGVLATLFTAALAGAGYNLRELLAWRREVMQLAEHTDMAPHEIEDARRLLLVLKERNPERLRTLRAAIRDTRTGGRP